MQQDRGSKRIHSTIYKSVISDYEMEWKRSEPIQKPIFSGNPKMNSNDDIT
jgi:hypothetical protein